MSRAPTLPSRTRQLVGRTDFVLVAVVVLAAVLRCWGLGSQSLWYDEWLTAKAAAGSMSELFRQVSEHEGIPPPYFLLMWGWARLFGDGETALRMVSALAGIATVPVAYAVVREFGQRRTVARVAALLVAVNPMLVWYSQEARPYGLVAFLGALSLLAFARIWKRGQPRDFLVWGFVSAVALAFHYFVVFLIIAEVLAVLVVRRRQWRELRLGCVPIVVVAVALAPFAFKQRSSLSNSQWIPAFRLTYRIQEAARGALVGPNYPDRRLWVVAAIIVLIAAALVLTRGDREERSVAALTAGIGAAAVVMPLLAIVFGFDTFLGRYLIAALVPFVVAVSVGLAARRASWVGGAGIAVLCAVSLGTVVAVARDPALQKADWGAVAESFARGNRDRVLVMNIHGQLGGPLFYYVKGSRALGATETVLVDEIDILVAKGTSKPCNLFVGRACSLIFLGAPPEEAVAAEFPLADRDALGQFFVERYRAAHPVSLSRSQLVRAADVDGLALVPAP